MVDTYFVCPDLLVSTNNLRICFKRLFKDSRDIMSDSIQPQWEAQDSFYVDVYEILTEVHTNVVQDSFGSYIITSTQQKTGRELAFYGNKKFADAISYVAKHHDNFESVVQAAMVLLEDSKFTEKSV